jgi:hypothetical protein
MRFTPRTSSQSVTCKHQGRDTVRTETRPLCAFLYFVLFGASCDLALTCCCWTGLNSRSRRDGAALEVHGGKAIDALSEDMLDDRDERNMADGGRWGSSRCRSWCHSVTIFWSWARRVTDIKPA